MRGFFTRTGVLWMFRGDDAFGRASADAVRAQRLRMEELSPGDAARRFPQINFAGVRSIFLEADAGLLHARRACEHVAERVVAEGGDYRQMAVAAPLRLDDGPLTRLPIASPWLPLLPEVGP